MFKGTFNAGRAAYLLMAGTLTSCGYIRLIDYNPKNGFATATPHPSSQTFLVTTNMTSSDMSVYLFNAANGSLSFPLTITRPMFYGPAAIVFESSGKFAYVDNVSGYTVSAYSIDPATGNFNELAGSPYAVGTVPLGLAIDPLGKFIFVGNSDSTAYSIMVFNRDAVTGKLAGQVPGSPFTSVKGAVYHSIAIDPTGQFLYCAENGNNTIEAFSIAANGALTPLATPRYSVGGNPIPLVMSPSGNHLYSTGYTSAGGVSGFVVNTVTGALTSIGPSVLAGTNPFAMTMDVSASHLFVANSGSNDLTRLNINALDGSLSASGSVPVGTAPWALTFDPSGNYLYVANHGANTISAFAYNSGTAALTPLAVPSYTSGAAPSSISFVTVPWP